MSFPIEAIFAHPDNGWADDQETARKHLTVGEVYTISRMEVGGSCTRIWLRDFPDVAFNSVMFDAAPAAEVGDLLDEDGAS